MTGDILNQRLDSILSFIETSMKSGAAFAQDQAPDVIQQLLAWKFYVHLIQFSFGIFVFLCCAYAGYRFIKWAIGDAVEELVPISLLLLLPMLGAVFMLMEGIKFIEILVAPKLYLLEYASSLLR